MTQNYVMMILPFLISPIPTLSIPELCGIMTVTVVYPAGVTGDWSAGFTDLTVTGIAALTDNLLNSTSDVQTVIYTFTPHIRPGDGGAECAMEFL